MTPPGHPAALFMLIRQGKGQEVRRCRLRRNTDQRGTRQEVILTAAMDGFFPSPAGGCVTSAPRKMTGCWNTGGL